jgi:hypothetical protein
MTVIAKRKQPMPIITDNQPPSADDRFSLSVVVKVERIAVLAFGLKNVAHYP